jgi:ATP-binding cassette, subfamily B, heavy metal transporter
MRRQFTDIENLNMKWHVLRLLWPYLLEFRFRTILAFVCLGLAKLTSISLPFILKFIVDSLDEQLSTARGSIDQSMLVAVPLALIVAYGLARFFNVMFNEIRDTLFGRVTERTIRRLSLQTFEHLHGLDLEFHLNRRTGGLSRDIERGTSGINFLMRFMIFNIIPTVLELFIVVGIFLANYGPDFAGVIFLSIVCYGIFSIMATERRTRFIREVNEADSATNTRAIDSLLNHETVKYFTNEAYEARHYDVELATWEEAKRKNRLSLFALNSGQALIVSASMTFMLGLAANGVATGVMTLGDFVLVNAFMMQLFIPLNFMGFVYREIKGALANIEKMFSLLGEKPQVVDRPGAIELETAKPVVSFNHVDFAYQPERSILQQVNFNIGAGQKVAVVGASGSGKSTLVKLLFRFYDCTGGCIQINGVDIRDYSLRSLRRAIGIVPQDTVLFNDSIKENIRYGRPEATEDEIQKAIKLANLDTFILKLPKGLETVVGERGLKLSGGEKQRVAIARTILKGAPILVFDEATSSLDSNTEGAILKAIREIAAGHTSLVIAHRLSTVVDADMIVVLDQGHIVERGTHEGLLAQEGYYHRLWMIQQKEEAERQVMETV